VPSAISGSVMMVAGLELTSTTSIALFLEGLARLGSRIVELAGLADDDGPGPDDHNFVNVGPFGHIRCFCGAQMRCFVVLDCRRQSWRLA
jgi:hypothetical protein